MGMRQASIRAATRSSAVLRSGLQEALITSCGSGSLSSSSAAAAAAFGWPLLILFARTAAEHHLVSGVLRLSNQQPVREGALELKAHDLRLPWL